MARLPYTGAPTVPSFFFDKLSQDELDQLFCWINRNRDRIAAGDGLFAPDVFDQALR
jgi:hypothetical protein